MGFAGAIFIACLDYGSAPSGVSGPYRIVAAMATMPGQSAGQAFTPGAAARTVTSAGSTAAQIGGQS